MSGLTPESGDRDLTQALVGFARFLREDGFRAAPSCLTDALKGLPLVDLADRNVFKGMLRANLASNHWEFNRFEDLFESFWQREAGPRPPAGPGEEAKADGHAQGVRRLAEPAQDSPEPGEPEPLRAGLEEVLAARDFSSLSEAEVRAMEPLVLALARKLGRRLSRRHIPTTGRGKLDIRRSLRGSLARGGEIISLRRRRKKPKPARIHLLLDVSGSMDAHGRFFMLFMYGLQRRLAQARAYVFSTRLTPVSQMFKSLPLAEANRRLAGLGANWSGGTDMGMSLSAFVRDHLLPEADSRGVVVLVSDGWDRGDPARLERAMAAIRRHSRNMVWLNPLLAGAGYEPICKGARAILPWVDHILPINDLKSLEHFCRFLGRVW